LRKHGLPIKLQDLPFRILIMLLENPGHIVSREHMQRRIWPGDTVVDCDHGISSAINKLRSALNDSAARPHFIETVGRRGYRLIYPVTHVPAASQPTPVSEAVTPAHPPPAPPQPRWRLWSVVAIVFCAAGLLAWSLYSARTKPAPIRSIAVLPLANLSSDPEQDYFSAGLTDELTTRLATLENLRVISRTSAMQYAHTTKTVPQIARELNVDAIVEGSVLRSGTRVRITAQLIETATDRHIWAQSYERDQRDILALQNDVARDIADHIMVKLEPADRARLAQARPVDPEAHEAYLRGRFAFSTRRPDDIKRAAEFFTEATRLDPDYALAYSALADCYALLGGYTLDLPANFIPKARAAADKALALDSSLAEAHLSLAVIAQNYDMDWAEAERQYRRALELNPKLPTAHHWYAEFLAFQGRFPEAFAHIEEARSLDPSSLILLTDRAVIYLYARSYDESIRQFKNVLARDPKFPRTQLIVIPYVKKGQYDAALKMVHLQDPEHHFAFTHATLAYIHGNAGNLAAARQDLQQLLALHNIDELDVSPLLYANIGTGNKDRAFALLERAFAQHSTVLSSLKVNPEYDSLRDDPRFAQLLKRAHLD
jgi:TolB-like protein/DNA-binding winged helix-turn-helix (wHTH) protein/Tfp pilus assembly protein PilF